MPRTSTAQMNDESIMPFGKYKNQKLANIPGSYFIFLYEHDMKDGPLKDYIVDNLDVLKKEK